MSVITTHSARKGIPGRRRRPEIGPGESEGVDNALTYLALKRVAKGRNVAGFFYARDIFKAGFSREEAEALGPGFVAEANRRQPFNQHGEQEEYTLDEFLLSVGSVYDLAHRADAIAGKALEDGIRGAPLAVLAAFLGLMLETGRDVLALARRPLMLRAGVKSRQTVDKAVRELVARGYLSYAGTASDGTLRYRVEPVHEPGQESVGYLSISFLAHFVHREAFCHKALGKHVLTTLSLIVAAPDGLTLPDLVAAGPFLRRTHKKHLDILLEYALVYEQGGNIHANFDQLEANLSHAAHVLGTEGERDAMVGCFARQRDLYKRLRRDLDPRRPRNSRLVQESAA